MLEDFLRVAQGIGIVLKTSAKKASSHCSHATSPFTYYPQSPLKQFIHNIETIKQHSVVHSSSNNNRFTTPSSQNTFSNNNSQFNNFQQQQAPSTTNNIFFDSYGNTEPSTTSNSNNKKEDNFDETILSSLKNLNNSTISEKINENKEDFQNVKHELEDEININMSKELKENKVPSNSISRAIHFASLGVKLGFNTAKEYSKKVIFGKEKKNEEEQPNNADNNNTVNTSEKIIKEDEKKNSSVETTINKEERQTQPKENKSSVISDVLTEQNAQILADTLCKMRGAALKLGQMLSLQDESIVSPVVLKALEKVRHSANVMPQWQLEEVMSQEFGEEWKSGFRYFDMKPMAAASIGQVHRGVLLDGREVAIKIQYPGVLESIDSDIKNVERIMKYTNLVPRGAFLGNTMEQARKELKMECDYIREAKCQKKFAQLIKEDIQKEKERGKIIGPPMSHFRVPEVIDEFTTRRVLCTELIKYGKTIDQIRDCPEEVRNRVARAILKLCLKELFEYRFMQTDPNWSNFFYDIKTDTLHLLDFGACMEFPQTFVDEYIRVVHASADRDYETVIDASRKMGFLTGEESNEMNYAHASAAMLVGEPFSKEGIFDFKNQLRTQDVTKHMSVMLKHRLTPPPPVTYSLHRKLSGAFSLCFKLNVQIPCRDLFMDIYDRYWEEKNKVLKKQ
ncbi:hypothetical protein ABK040_010259 [Willaertia magna]